MKQAFLFFLLLNMISELRSQDKPNSDKLTPKEFTIPTSPLFDLMGVAPNLVARTANIKDFKVDWSFNSWRINPNLAIEAQPIWEIFYNKKSITKYQKASPLLRRLSSLDLSIGTVQSNNDDRRIGSALKVNIYSQKDPLLAKNVYEKIEKSFAEELVDLKQKEKQILHDLDSLTKPDEVKKLRDLLKENDVQLTTFYNRRNAAIQAKAATFISDNWNAAFIDFAFGKIFTYSTDSVGALNKLQLNRNTGNGAWLNFGFGIGKRGLISGLIRSSFYEEEVTFNIKDNSTNLETSETTIASNKLISFGINFRYGGPIYNFFAEFITEAKTIATPIDAINRSFNTPSGKTIISSSVKWNAINPYTINFGGDWRISRNVILNYGIRCILDKNFNTTSFIPVANIACMMR